MIQMSNKIGILFQETIEIMKKKGMKNLNF